MPEALVAKIAGIDRPKSLTEHAYRRLKTAIREGSLVPEHFYPLGQMATQLGISRTPVREAVLRLEHDGLVEIVRQRGFRVRRVPWEEAAEVFELRSIIEGRALERVVKRAGPQDIRTLRAILRRQGHVTSDTARFLDIDEEFHLQIVEMAGLRRAKDFLITLRDVVWLVGFEVLRRRSRSAEVLAEHTAIVDAIEAGDPARVRQALDRHLASTYTKIKGGLVAPSQRKTDSH
ncbi:MAG: GntR family transcriptional regulator [Candidatus Binatia bacterium]